jgi:hypothetical protein
MPLNELTQTRLIALAVGLAIVAYWLLGRAKVRRRQARFAALARSLGGEVVREGEFLSRFPVEIAGRMFDVRLQHIGRGSSGGAGGWYVVTRVALQGVSGLHSVDIRPRLRRILGVEPRGFEEDFTLVDAGYPLRAGWLTDHVRGAIAHFYALELPPDPLVIEEGRLIHRAQSPVQRFDGPLLRELLTRQAAVAAALEQAL